jgi:hypothetical protein
MIGNNALAIGALILIVISLLGNLMVFKKAGEFEQMPLKKMTGRVTTGYVNITILRSLTELNVRAKLEPDDRTVTLFWEDIGQENVSIYITDDLESGFDYGHPNASGITGYNWSDPTAGDAIQRFYKIGIHRLGVFNVTVPTVGKYQIEVKEADGDPTGFEINQISLPLIPYNESFEDIVRSANNGDIVLRT